MPFDERVAVALAAMDANIWLHTSHTYGDTLRVLRAAFDQSRSQVPKLIAKIYGIQAPAAPRDDLVAAFLTGIKGLNQPPAVTPSEQLRLNTKIAPSSHPNRLGVLAGDNAGFPNGRRLADDVVDIELQAVEGAVKVDKAGAPTGVTLVKPLAAGDGVNANDVAFGTSCPYLPLPNSGSGSGGAHG